MLLVWDKIGRKSAHCQTSRKLCILSICVLSCHLISHELHHFLALDRRVAPPLAVVRTGGGGVRGILPRNVFEIRVQNPAFWALLALFYYGGCGRAKKWSGRSRTGRSGCYAPGIRHDRFSIDCSPFQL